MNRYSYCSWVTSFFIYLSLLLLPATALSLDVDNDTLPGEWELFNGLNPYAPDYLISAGTHVSCGIADGGPACWGSTGSGQTSIPGLTDVQQFAVGSAHVCALDSTGVVCWGDSSNGKTTPPAMTGVTQISSFKNHTCAVHDSGVSCWGDNGSGQTSVPALVNPTQVTAGGAHSCAIDDNGVTCWGSNADGQSTPSGITNPVSDLVVGERNSCAVNPNGSVSCWGLNGLGQSSPPVMSDAIAVSVGQNTACALRDNGSTYVTCWGASGAGQDAPPALDNPIQITSGYQHNCALDDGGIKCWGRNSEGQTNTGSLTFDIDGDGVANGTDNCRLTPNAGQEDVNTNSIGDACEGDDDLDNDTLPNDWETFMGRNPNVPDYLIQAGYHTTCGKDESTFSCWGDANDGQNTIPSLTNLKQFAVGRDHVCALDDNGVQCWGDSANNKLNVPAVTGVTQISAFQNHTCAIHDSGLICWGNNTSGYTNYPIFANPQKVVAGGNHTCALDNNGVQCWGNDNTSGQLNVPVLTSPTDLAAGLSNSCAVHNNGAVICWGLNGLDQSNPPAMSDAIAVSVGQNTACALRVDASGNNYVTCWGSDGSGQGTPPPLVNPVQLTSGYQHNCALDNEGIKCWGRNAEGQIDTAGLYFDSDGDGTVNSADIEHLVPENPTDYDEDGVDNDTDNCIFAPNPSQLNFDSDSEGDACDLDDDNDGTPDVDDAFPYNAAEDTDTDNDGIGNNADFDDDDDGVPDGSDAFPLDPAESLDTDNDGIGNNADLDDDDDGTPDVSDAFPLDPAEDADTDTDGIGNNADEDDDGDGEPDITDAYPLDPTETVDTDGDGIGDNADPDADNDGIADSVDPYPTDDTAPQIPQFTINGDSADDHLGASVSGTGDINGDGFSDVVVGAHKGDGSVADAGFARIHSGINGAVLYTFLGDDADDFFGWSVSDAGDVNNDGVNDVIVGANQDDDNGTDSGSARVFSGINGTVLYTFYGDSAGDQFGYSVSGAGDINGDGYADLVVGAFEDDNNGDASGSARVFSGFDGSVLYTFDGDASKDRLGHSVSGAGDINNDGYGDVIVGAPYDDNNGASSGMARVYSGVDGSTLYTFDGDDAADLFGYSVSDAGDINMDGYADVIVGIQLDDDGMLDAGGARVFSGIDGSTLYTFYGEESFERFGNSVSGAGDVDKDGTPDLMVGADHNSSKAYRTGRINIFSGADGARLYDIYGDSADDRFGYSVSALPVLQQDGIPAIAVGAWADDNTGILSGSVRIYRFELDEDQDGMPDDWENTYALDPQNAGDATQDADNDNLTNLQEYQLGTNPLRADSDGDGLNDDAEDANLNALVDRGETNPAKADTDGDGLNDYDEINVHSTFPLVADSDFDTLPDGVEIALGTNPLHAQYQITSGGFHSCAMDDNGVSCWGSNADGQTSVPILHNPRDISAGKNHTCAADDYGVDCWGSDAANQSSVPGMSNAVKVAAGELHSCAIDDSGVQCWGDNFFDQRNVPVLNNPQDIDAGDHHTCVLDENGGVNSVVCWGYNSDGQTDVPPLTNPWYVSAGRRFSCAADDNGFQCWGLNDYGQSTAPVQSSQAHTVDAGGFNACGVYANGVLCWGANGSGQSDVPILIKPAAVATGESHSCALTDAGVVCWGLDSNGQATPSFTDMDPDGDGLRYNQEASLGTDIYNADSDGDGIDDGVEDANNNGIVDVNETDPANSDTDGDTLSDFVEITVYSSNPLLADTDHDGVPDASELVFGMNPFLPEYLVDAGAYHNCALDENGIVCWGDNSSGQTNVPVLTNPVAVSAGARHSCAIDDSGVVCWGEDVFGQGTPPVLSNPVQVSAGELHSCAIDVNGGSRSVVCWGNDTYGQGSVPALNNPQQVAAANYHTCALDEDGGITSVVCWGYNVDGQTTVPSLNFPSLISVGNRFSCAVDANGLSCWGRNGHGQTDVPVLTGAYAVAAGGYHTCGIDINDASCWGNNGDGQSMPPALSDISAVTTGEFHSCALSSAGVTCWGNDGFGQSTVAPLFIDPDNDGVSNPQEALLGTDGFNRDSDGDGIDDGVEDANQNGIVDGGETDPADDDSDNDGFSDGDEINVFGTDPLAANNDTDGDGEPDDYDIDDDNDGTPDVSDPFPLDASENNDADGDGIGDNADRDDDNDSVADVVDPDPFDDQVPYLPQYTVDGIATDDHFGVAVGAAGDINSDGTADFIVGAYKSDVSGFDSGQAQVFSGADGALIYTFNGDSSEDYFGRAVAGAGDVDNDGIDDFVVGAYGDDDNGAQSGSARVFSGADGSVLYTFYGDNAGDLFGYAVSSAGDVNNDNYDDIVVGAYEDDNNGDRSGSVRVFSGQDGSVLYTFNGDSTLDRLGFSVSDAGDVNGDGYGDVVAGAPFDDNNWASSGSAKIFSGIDGNVLYVFNGDGPNDLFGHAVSGAGDVNNDGFDDVIIGAYGDDNSGTDTGSARVISGWDGTTLFTIDGERDYARLGFAVGEAGDINNDGYDDVIVGADKNDITGFNAGAARIYSGLDGGFLYTFYGEGAEDHFAYSVSMLPVVIQYGTPSAVVGAWGDDNNGDTSGSVRVVSFSVDVDLDGMPDAWEDQYGLDKNSAADAVLDNDTDGLSNLKEFQLETNPTLADSDSDGLDDGVEDANQNGSFDVGETDATDPDTDGDTFSDGDEVNVFGTDPLVIDSNFDGDGLPDSYDDDDDNDGVPDVSDLFPLDPSEATDYDNDGVGDNADLDDDNDSVADIVDPGPQNNALPYLPAYSVDGVEADDHFGVSVAETGDINGDGVSDYIVGAYKADTSNGVDSGEAQVFSGADGVLIYTFKGFVAEDYFGRSVAGAGDVNNDGVNDFIVGAYGRDGNGNQAGAAYIYSGADGSLLYDFHGDSAGDLFGASVDGAGDVNNDGYDDMIVGAYEDDNNGDRSGSARVFSGADGSILYTFNGDSLLDRLGFSVAGAGDVNSDGYADVIAGAPFSDNVWVSSGSAKVFSGIDGSVLYTFNGSGQGHVFGSSVSGAGDVNNDGLDDLIVGAYGDDHTGIDMGSAWILSGADGSTLFALHGERDYARFGFSVSNAGDVNNDGHDDVIVGADHNDTIGYRAGVARIYSGADGNFLYTFYSEGAEDHFGYSVAVLPVLVPGGAASAVIGAWGDDNTGDSAGSVRVVSFMTDTDADGLPDSWEDYYGLDKTSSADAALDGDSDNLTNSQEYSLGTDPASADTDGDGINDDVDAFPLNAGETLDTDGDGLGDNIDIDDDNDGIDDIHDPAPLDENQPWVDINMSDFDADLDGDLLFQQSGTLEVGTWLLENANTDSTIDVDTAVATISAYGDMDADADADIAFDTGTNIVIWEMEDGDNVSVSSIASPAGYTLTFVGNLDDDKDVDFIFEDGAGNIITWLMEDRVKAGESWLGVWPGQSVKAVADVDNDGDDDVITQDASGNVNVVEIENGARVAARWIGQWSGRDVVSAGDVDNDGDADILMETTSPTGDVMVIEMEAGIKVIGRWLGVWSGTKVLAVGDIDNDGDVDLIQQNSGTGSVQVVELQNGTKVTGRWLGTFSYTVKGVVDADGDGDVDVIMQDGSGNVVLIELENGTKLGGAKWLGVNSGDLYLF